MTKQSVRVPCKLRTLPDGTEIVLLQGVELTRFDPNRIRGHLLRLPKEKLIEAQTKMGNDVFYKWDARRGDYKQRSAHGGFCLHRCSFCESPFIGLSTARYCKPDCVTEMIKRKEQLQRERNAAHREREGIRLSRPKKEK